MTEELGNMVGLSGFPLRLKQFQDNEDISMAVGQARMTRSRRGMRRSHDALSATALSTDATSGEVHRRHHVSPDGFYRGKKVVESKND